MFTGIIEELGKVKKIMHKGKMRFFEITADKALQSTREGESIAVNGVCLTVVSLQDNFFSFGFSFGLEFGCPGPGNNFSRYA